MKQSGLLADLVAHYTKVGAPEEKYAKTDIKEQINAEGIKYFQVPVYLESEGLGQRKIIYYYVRDEGTAKEEAFYRSIELPYIKPELYRTEVEILIQDKITAGEFVRGDIEYCNEELLYAKVRGFVFDTDRITEKEYFVYKDEGANKFYPANFIVD